MINHWIRSLPFRFYAALALGLVLTLHTGCTVPRFVDDRLPEGSAKHARFTVSGKFSTTNVEADNYVKTEEKVTADRLTFKHSNAWVPNAEVVLEGYERARSKDDERK